MRRFLVIILMISGVFFTSEKAMASCLTGNCHNGKGTYLFKDGTKYVGTFYKSKLHGKGTLYMTDGSVYQGDFISGAKEGLGKLVFKSGDTYAGAFVSDIVSGEGRMQYRNGDSYIGTWVNGKSSGKGKYTFSDGDYYVGTFLDGEFNGSGKMVRKDGSYFDGKWIRNKKHGEGVAYATGKKMIHRYNMNKLISEEKYTETAIAQQQSSSPTGQTKVQAKPIKNCTNQPCHNEKGFFRYGDGSIFEGDFVHGESEGYGVCKYANGDRYEGQWKNHAPHGNGTLFFKSGNIYAALWDNGVPTQKANEEVQKPVIAQTKPVVNENTTDVGKTEIFALVVGVATYNHMQSLKYTDDDAYQLFAFLKSPEGGAIPDDNIKILIDDAATNKSITQEINQIASRADDNDVILLYLSGHGLDGSFVPSDFDGSKNQLAYGDVLDILNGSAAKHKLFITDACHSGSMLAAARTPLNVSLENFYSAYNTINGGTAIMMSSKKEEVSLEYGGLRQGIFSHFLIKGLKGYADKNADKLISVTELYDYVSSNVKSYTVNAQNPVIMGDFDKDMPVGLVR